MGNVMSDDIKTLIEAQGRAFEEFKSANNAKLELLKKGQVAPSDLEEKLKKIDEDLNTKFKAVQAELAKANRPKLDGKGREIPAEVAEYRDALTEYMRTGESKADLHALQKKAVIGLSLPDAGYLLDDEIDSQIDRVAEDVYAVAGLVGSQTVGSRGYKKRVKTRGVGARRIGIDTTGQGETTAPQYAEIKIDVNTLEAEPWAYNDTLEDVEYNLVADLVNEGGVAFGETIGNEVINGTGVGGEMRGLLSYTAVANASYAWGSIGYVASGASGDFASSNPGDNLIDLTHSLKQQYRNGAVLVMSDTTLAKVRKFKDGSGNFYLFNPDPSGGFAGTVLGKPVVIDDYMPAIASNSLSIIYANLSRAYKRVERRGTILIRDNITTKGVTKFNMTRRNGGDIVNFEAIKVMKFAAT